MGKIIAINLVACFLVSLIVQCDTGKRFCGLSIGFGSPMAYFFGALTDSYVFFLYT